MGHVLGHRGCDLFAQTSDRHFPPDRFIKRNHLPGDFNPFSGIMYSQNGVVKGQSSDALTSEEIITMDWLAQNIVGSIPSKDDLDEPARDLAAVQGVKEEDRLP